MRAVTASRKKTPWHRIFSASLRGAGVRLSAEEVNLLSRDEAISLRGQADAGCWRRGHDPERCVECWRRGHDLTDEENSL